jgi:threonine dehydrogenase-like Zn-dependent dehydrogenase
VKAAEYGGPRQVGLRDAPVPEPGPGEVVVQVRACGICGSDLHRFRAGGLGAGITPGHEIAGVVAAVGPRVSGWDVGAPVAVEPLVTCRSCDLCAGGNYQLCPERRLLGVAQDGGLAEYVRVPAYALFAAPVDLDMPVLALTEPAAVAIHALRLVDVRAGERVLVQGSGAIGLLSALAAREAGAEVTSTARYPHQVAAATAFGASEVFPADEAGTKDLLAKARTRPFDVVLETVGGESDTLELAPALARPMGRVCVLGVFFHPPRLNAIALVIREVRMIGSITYGRINGVADFDLATDLVVRHRATAASLITHRAPLEDITTAYALADDKASLALKVTVEP